MNTEVRGIRGQLVTTWGRDLEGDVWVGPERAMKWKCTCRCGRKAGGSGFGSPQEVEKKRWVRRGVRSQEELFCSVGCAQAAYPHYPRTTVQLSEVLFLLRSTGSDAFAAAAVLLERNFKNV